MTDNTAHAQALLRDNSYVVLATADASGHPWATPVWFAPDGLDRLFWLSEPGARHSRLIEQRPEVALTVFDSTVVPHEGAALYATARAAPVTSGELDAGLELVNHRSSERGIGVFTREQVTGPARLRLYVAELLEVWVLDQDAEVDQRARVQGR